MSKQHTITQAIYIITPNGEWEIKPDQIKPLGKGGTAQVYSLNNNDNLLLKIYHANILDKYAQHYADKLQAMLAKPPKNTQITIQGKEQKYHQFAWPLHLVKNKNQQIIGYAMYRLKKDEFFSLQEYLDQNIADKKERETIIDKSLDIRIQVAFNLSLCVRNLHKVGHLFVDMKQENIFIHKQDRTVCFIDCDGFSIEQGKYPALHYSNNYKAPFVLKQNLKPTDLSNEQYQDNYCLAHLIFEILNYGITPFKGVPSEKIQEEILNSGSENTNDYKVKNQLYPYAVNRQFKGIYPDKMSIHQYWPEDIQHLFERAFYQNKEDIPNATEWAKCLHQHIKNANFEKCNQYPDNELHHHFKGTHCFACEVFNDSSKNKPTKNTPDIDEYLTQNAVSDLLSSSSSSSSVSVEKENLAANELSDEKVQSAIKAFEHGGYAEALSVFRKAANQGNKDAQYYLGLMYQNGLAVKQNDSYARRWYKKAAELGHAKAQQSLQEMANNATVSQNTPVKKVAEVTEVVEKTKKQPQANTQAPSNHATYPSKQNKTSWQEKFLIAVIAVFLISAMIFFAVIIFSDDKEENQTPVASEETVVSDTREVADDNRLNNKGRETQNTLPDKQAKFKISDEVKANYPELVKLILETESMKDDERQYWFDIIPSMTSEEIDRLFNILDTEKKKLEALRKNNAANTSAQSSSNFHFDGVEVKNFRTINNANIRSCGKDSCDSLGLIPQGASISPVSGSKVGDDFWQVKYSGKLCATSDYANGKCNNWQEDQSVQGYIATSLIVFDMDLNQFSVKESQTPTFLTSSNVNMRECFSGVSSICKPIGVVPIMSPIYPLLDKDGDPVQMKFQNKDWRAVQYSGEFCHPDSKGCLEHLPHRTARGWIAKDYLVAGDIGDDHFLKVAEKYASQGNYSEALQIYQPLAQKGNAEAQFHLGFMYENGYGVEQDHRKAVKWYQKSTEQGNIYAQNNLGYLYEKGYGVEQNYKKAVALYQKAAEQGVLDSQMRLGDMYKDGQGVERNISTACKWYKKAGVDYLYGVCQN